MLDACHVGVDELRFGAVTCDERGSLVAALPAQPEHGVREHDRALAALLAMDEDARRRVVGQDTGGEVRCRRP